MIRSRRKVFVEAHDSCPSLAAGQHSTHQIGFVRIHDTCRSAVGNDDNGFNSGHVQVFKFTNDEWVQQGESLSGDAPGDYFGNSVAISGDGKRVFAGAHYNDANGSAAGQVKAFELTV